MVAPVSGVGGLGTLARTFPVGVGSLDFVTHADTRHGQNRARDNSPRERQNGHFLRWTDSLCTLWRLLMSNELKERIALCHQTQSP
jgi:hypothetical protein